MRYSTDHKEQTRHKLVAAAAETMRRDGPDRLAVAGIMKQLGLTHGGFYAHFASKDALIAAAIDAMFAQSATNLSRRIADLPPHEALTRYIDFYLSKAHSAATGMGCPLPAIAADVSRLGPEARARFAAGMDHLGQMVAPLWQALGHNAPDSQTLAVTMFSEMAGAVVLARAVGTEDHAAAIRDASRAAILRRLSPDAALPAG